MRLTMSRGKLPHFKVINGNLRRVGITLRIPMRPTSLRFIQRLHSPLRSDRGNVRNDRGKLRVLGRSFSGSTPISAIMIVRRPITRPNSRVPKLLQVENLRLQARLMSLFSSIVRQNHSNPLKGFILRRGL